MYRIYLNAGHDKKYDSGAVNPISGLRECDVAANVAEKVKYYLENVGYECRLGQSDNLYYDSIYIDRQDFAVVPDANNWDADLFISIHCNAFNTSAQGTETLIYNNRCREAKKLAECIQQQIVDSLGTTDRGIKERQNLIVLKMTDAPAVLVELAFIDNEEDAKLLVEKQDDFARAIARGVTDYYNL